MRDVFERSISELAITLLLRSVRDLADRGPDDEAQRDLEGTCC
jgi:hypothetical protein